MSDQATKFPRRLDLLLADDCARWGVDPARQDPDAAFFVAATDGEIRAIFGSDREGTPVLGVEEFARRCEEIRTATIERVRPLPPIPVPPHVYEAVERILHGDASAEVGAIDGPKPEQGNRRARRARRARERNGG